jgi:hypothetical protein
MHWLIGVGTVTGFNTEIAIGFVGTGIARFIRIGPVGPLLSELF